MGIDVCQNVEIVSADEYYCKVWKSECKLRLFQQSDDGHHSMVYKRGIYAAP